MGLIAGLDVGTTGCKVTVFTFDGRRLGREYRDYATRRGGGVHEVVFLELIHRRQILKCHTIESWACP